MGMRSIRATIWRILAASAASALLATTAWAGFYCPTKSYFSLRRQLGLADRTADSNGHRELRGALSGTAQQDVQTIFVLNGDGESYCVTVKNPAPEIVPGNRLRMIVKTDTGPSMELVAFTYEAEAAEIERAAIEHETKIARSRQAASYTQSRSSVRRTRSFVTTSRGSTAVDAASIIAQYANATHLINPRLSDSEAVLIARCVLGYGQHYGVDPRLVMAVIWAESGFRPTATSSKGAMGLGQLMPGTATGLGVWDAYDPIQNIEASVRLIRGHLTKLSGSKTWNDLTWDHLALALASYNAGSGSVRKYHGIPPYRETRRYIKRVTDYYCLLCGIK